MDWQPLLSFNSMPCMTMLWLSLQGDVCSSRRLTFTLYTAGYSVVYVIASLQWYKCKRVNAEAVPQCMPVAVQTCIHVSTRTWKY